MILAPRAAFTRPGDTNAYSIGDLVANSVTAGSVTPLVFPVPGLGGAGVKINAVRMTKSVASATLATFALHLFNRPQAVVGGDNAAFQVPVMGIPYLGSIPLDMATGGVTVAASTELFKLFQLAAPIYVDVPAGNVYGYLVAGAAYVPAASEIFTIGLGLEA